MAMKRTRHRPSIADELCEIKHSLQHVNCTLEKIVANTAEISATLDRAIAKQEKTITEIKALQGTVTTLKDEIAALKVIVAQGGEISQEVVDKVNRVEELAGQADEEIPDLEPIPTP